MGQRGSSGVTEERRAVAKRMAFAAVATVAIWVVAWIAAPLSDGYRWRLLAGAMLGPALCLAGGVAFVARHRFFNSGAMAGADPADDATLLQAQAYLRNTTEQALLAGFAYVAMSVTLPNSLLLALPFSAVTFVLGRIGFAIGSRGKARRRAFGFALTFYPTLAGLFASALLLLISGG